jgi:hypothetical protein
MPPMACNDLKLCIIYKLGATEGAATVCRLACDDLLLFTGASLHAGRPANY